MLNEILSHINDTNLLMQIFKIASSLVLIYGDYTFVMILFCLELV